MPFGISIVHGDDHVVVSPSGDVDIATSSEFRDVSLAAIEQDPPLVVIDLSAVTFMDSTGLGVLVQLRHETEARELGLRLVSGRRTNAILKISGLTEAFDIHPSLHDALNGPGETA